MKKFLLIGFFLVGCNVSRNQQPLILDPPETQRKAEDLDFKTVKAFVLNPACINCHSAKDESGGVNLETYENVFKHVPQIKLEIGGSLMPPDKQLTALQTKMLNDWIEAGAKENAGDSVSNPSPAPAPTPNPNPNPAPPSPSPAPSEVSFSDVMEQVIKTNCLGCHAAATGNKGHVNLESYENVSANLSELMEAVNEDRMPPKKGIPLTAVQKQLLVSWFTQGAKP